MKMISITFKLKRYCILAIHPKAKLKKVTMIFHRLFIAIFKMYDVSNEAFNRNFLCRINFVDKTSIQTTSIFGSYQFLK